MLWLRPAGPSWKGKVHMIFSIKQLLQENQKDELKEVEGDICEEDAENLHRELDEGELTDQEENEETMQTSSESVEELLHNYMEFKKKLESLSLYELVQTTLNAMDLHWTANQYSPEVAVFNLTVWFEGNRYLLEIMTLDEEDPWIQMDLSFPCQCRKAYRLPISMELNQMSNRRKFGSYRCDPDTGEIIFRISYKIAGSFSPALFQEYVDMLIGTANADIDKIEQLANGNYTAEKTVYWVH